MFNANSMSGNGAEQKALMLRLKFYLNLRWLVVVGIVAVTLVASTVFLIQFPTTPIFIICGIIAFYNLLLYFWTRRLTRDETSLHRRDAETSGYVQILLDLIALTALLHFTGGVENPFIFFYNIHTIAASKLLRRARAFQLTTLAVLMALLLIFLEFTGVVPHVNLVGFVGPEAYIQVSRVTSVTVTLIILAYTGTYVTTAIAGQMRRVNREVIQLRDQLLDRDEREIKRVSEEVTRLEGERRSFVRLLSVVAHDLQAPLVAVQSCISYVIDGYTGDVSESQKDWLQKASRRVDGLLTLIADLLDIPRIETGQIKREMREINLNDVVSRSTEGLDAIAEQKGIKLFLELPATSPVVFASNRRLQQVITNLANNAINYTRDGTVTIRIKEDEKGARVEVIDTGVGISPEDLPKLFSDFYRGSNVDVKGTGLGLSISKRIIEAHGGQIWAESPCAETGKGSRFTFTLPKLEKQNEMT